MQKTALQLVASACTHTGNVRAANQDAYGYSVEGQCFVVCDGMGGPAGGEVASRLAVETVLERLALDPSGAAIARKIEQAISAANRIVYTRACRDPDLHGMGTTLVALVVHEESAWIAHVGDSRCYRLRAGALACCTKDHSLVEQQIRLGQLTRAQAAASPIRHVITRAIGVDKTVSLELRELALQPGDRFLLCSDGLTRELEEPQIAALLSTAGDPGMLADLLVDAALSAGGADNITALTVQVG